VKKYAAWLCRLGLHNWHKVMGKYFMERWCDRCLRNQYYDPEDMIWLDDRSKP